MIICPKCYSYDKCKRMGWADAEKCANYDPRMKPRTNFDRIKAMSVDELAQAIYQGISSDPCDYCKNNNLHCTGEPCKEKANADIIAEWLESEVKNDEAKEP